MMGGSFLDGLDHTTSSVERWDETDRALWCHLYWLEEAWESWSTEAAGAESARDNLIASLDRAWGMDT